MKKNGQYVGVDEKYIPKEEKYVDNETNKEIKDSINDGLSQIKNYVTDKDNQEKMKKTGRKGLKILKGIGIGYIIFFGIIVMLAISIFAIVFVNMAKANNKTNDIYNQANSVIDKITDEMDDSNKNSDITNSIPENSKYKERDIKVFNAPFELYNGTQVGSFVTALLNKVITSNKTETEHIITIIYNETMYVVENEINTLMQGVDKNKEYIVSLDYDSEGFVNKITIK